MSRDPTGSHWDFKDFILSCNASAADLDVYRLFQVHLSWFRNASDKQISVSTIKCKTMVLLHWETPWKHRGKETDWSIERLPTKSYCCHQLFELGKNSSGGRLCWETYCCQVQEGGGRTKQRNIKVGIFCRQTISLCLTKSFVLLVCFPGRWGKCDSETLSPESRATDPQIMLVCSDFLNKNRKGVLFPPRWKLNGWTVWHFSTTAGSPRKSLHHTVVLEGHVEQAWAVFSFSEK